MPDLIVGSSIDAVIGAAFAIEPDAALLRRQIVEVFRPGGSSRKGFKRLAENRRHTAVRRGVLQRVTDFADRELRMNMALIRGSLLSEKELQECVSPFVPTVRQQVAAGILFILLFAGGHCLPIAVAGSSTAAVRRLV